MPLVLRPRGVPERLAHSAARGVAFRFGERRRHPGVGFISRLNRRSLHVPCQRFALALADADA